MKTILALILAGSASLLGADDANSIIRRLVEAEKLNAERASQYTYVERKVDYAFDKDGTARQDRTQTHEIIFVEGESYRKLVARNDRPLDVKEQSKEDLRLKQTAAERRKKRQFGPIERHFSLGERELLLTLFDNRIVGEEDLRGRRNWVIECKPKTGSVSADKQRKDVLAVERKLWIDQTDFLVAREFQLTVGDHSVLMPGTTWVWDHERFNDTWLLTSINIDGKLHFAKLMKPRVKTEIRNAKFQKFDVKSTITIEPAS